MCYNCGCGMPNDPMGKGHAGFDPQGKSITNKTIEEAAKSQNMSVEDAKREMLKMLQEELSAKPS